MAVWIPSGFDRADGVSLLPSQPAGSGGTPRAVGTPDPDGGLIIIASGGYTFPILEEYPDSPIIEFAEQCTTTHRFKMLYVDALGISPAIQRGVFIQDSFSNLYRVLYSTIQSVTGSFADVSVTTESVSFDQPPDEFQCVPVELGLDIIKHPRYFWAINPVAQDYAPLGVNFLTIGTTKVYYADIKFAIIRAIQTYRDSPFFPSPDNINGLVHNNVFAQFGIGNSTSSGNAVGVSQNVAVANANFDPGSPETPPVAWNGNIANLPTTGNPRYFITTVPFTGSDTNPITIALAAAKEIITKLWRMEDSPSLPGFQMTWVQYFFASSSLDPGGYIQDPLTVVPEYFTDPNSNLLILPRGDLLSGNTNLDVDPPKPAGDPSIFTNMSFVNPQCYSSTGLNGGPINFSSLRKSDEVEFQRTWFRVTHTWLIAPIGVWDKDIYTQGNRPQKASDYNTN